MILFYIFYGLRKRESIDHRDDSVVEGEENANNPEANVIAPLRYPSLFDLQSINVNMDETEDPEQSSAEPTLDNLPPSYSIAEGLNDLPTYSEVDISRVRVGPYVMIYNKDQKNVMTFKKGKREQEDQETD